jgi:hypothetical protein
MLTRLTLSERGLAAAMRGATAALAPRLSAVEPDGAPLREHGLADDTGALTAAGAEWFEPLRAPTYVFRVERSVLGLESAQSFYVHLPSLRCLHVTRAGEDEYALAQRDVADVIYAGLLEAAGIWPDTHPELAEDATPPDPEESLRTTLVVLHDEDGGFSEHELSWIDDEGVWLLAEDGSLSPASDRSLYQRIPLMLHVLDR